jgi:hypothetical protein
MKRGTTLAQAQRSLSRIFSIAGPASTTEGVALCRCFKLILVPMTVLR